MSLKALFIIGLVFLPTLLTQTTSDNTVVIPIPGDNTTVVVPPTADNTTVVVPADDNTTVVVPPVDNTTVVVPPVDNTTVVVPPVDNTTVVAPPADNTTAVIPPGPVYTTIGGARLSPVGDARALQIIDIDLALDYTTRWAEVAAIYQNQLASFFSQVNASNIAAALALPAGANIVLAAMQGIDYASLAAYNLDVANNLQAFSNLTNISIADLAILNFVYDYATSSTAVVAEDATQNVLHGFSFDSPRADLIAPLAYHARYFNNGVFLFEGFSLAGYLGLVAGYKAGVYSASVNRLFAPPTLWQQLGNFADDLGSFVLQYLTPSLALRQGFIETTNFDDLINYLSNTATISDTFYTIAGSALGQGAVLTKNRVALENRADISDSDNNDDDTDTDDDNDGVWYLVQSNYLRNVTDPATDNRATGAVNILNTLTQANVNTLSLKTELMDVFPVFNNYTVWNVVMQPNGNFSNLTLWW